VSKLKSKFRTLLKKTEEKFALRTPGANLSGLDYSNVADIEKLLIDISKEMFREEGRKQEVKNRKTLVSNNLTALESQVPGMRTSSPLPYQSASTLFPVNSQSSTIRTSSPLLQKNDITLLPDGVLEIDLVSNDATTVGSPSPVSTRASGARRSAHNDNLEFAELIKMLRGDNQDHVEVIRKRALEDRKMDLEEKWIALELRKVEVSGITAAAMLANSNALTIALEKAFSFGSAGSKP